ncbi:Complexed with Cdc5 protein cwf19 [Ceratobasidium theobromae]|uniref:Complexed with Cdc5 protein cwf19 n=1 Tax=Ceratobasidium theobromae TaxID=1582974 RepID=A0A5N5QGI3_9AGAM|nr:Complexed with Cdc5 protein cwf19 [Ceratobasidium theobromae]
MDSATTEKHKSRHRADSDDEHRSKKRKKDKKDEREHRKDRDKDHKKDRERGKDKHRKHKSKSKDQGINVVDDDEEDVWVEKNIDGEGGAAVVSNIPTAGSLGLTSNASIVPPDAKLPPSNAQPTQTKLQRDEWMLLEPSAPIVPVGTPSRPPDRAVVQTADEMTDGFGEEVRNMRTLGGGVDFFSSLGTEHRKKPPPKDPNEKPRISAREINREPEPEPTTAKEPPVPGAPGSQWRMLRLKRTYQEAEDEGRPLEDVIRDRWDSWEHWEAALAERKWLDERATSSSQRGPGGRGSNTGSAGGSAGERYMFSTPTADLSRSSSRNSFRKPGESAPTTPGAGPATGANAMSAFKGRVDELKGATREVRSGVQSPKSSTPIPTVMAPVLPPKQGKKKAVLSTSELNKLQAKALRAKLMGGEDADRLQAEYDEAVRAAAGGGSGDENDQEETRVEALPSMDGHGRLYDVGTGKGDPGPILPGNRRKNQDKFETRDPKTGELLRINADDDTQTLSDLLREERLGGGPADQKNLDAALAGAIARDGKYEDDLEYVDDNAERLARRKMKSDAMKRQFAIQDYARTQKVLASCVYCPGNSNDEMAPPRAGVIAMGTRVYLAVTPNEELVPGHCHIVPLQHMLSSLEGDDDVWDEVKNFMKCLMRTFAEEDKGVIFYETVMSLRQQRHTVIECVPVPREEFTELPAYFRESILASESEWSQHKKLIDFSKRPGGFRRSMVPNLPYFMVQWDYKGEQGYGHVIEGRDMADDPDGDVDEGDKGGGQFPRWFAGEIIGNILDIEPRRWRRPRKEDFRMNDRRVEQFRKKFDKYDWTKMLAQS